ncbi:MAG: hypothetical protein IJR13_07650 [Bacteroidales bacterium]|nr:hypothetical protein [Bacteroidales bacterium]
METNNRISSGMKISRKLHGYFVEDAEQHRKIVVASCIEDAIATWKAAHQDLECMAVVRMKEDIIMAHGESAIRDTDMAEDMQGVPNPNPNDGVLNLLQ